MSTTLTRMLAALALAGAVAAPADVQAQDIERGRQLYENHCQACHTAQVHGRKNRIAFDVGDLREIVDRWQRNQKLNWGRDEIEDVVQYLGTTRYFFMSRAEEKSLSASTGAHRTAHSSAHRLQSVRRVELDGRDLGTQAGPYAWVTKVAGVVRGGHCCITFR